MNIRTNTRWHPMEAVAALAIVAMVATGCSGPESPGQNKDGFTGSAVGPVPAAAQEIMDQEPYRTARWTYQVSELESGKLLMANRPNEMVFTASSAKQFTVGSAYELLGPDSRLTTPVYAVGQRAGNVLRGNLVLVASGDLTMGGRNALEDRVDSSFTATTTDHVYGDVAPNAVKPPGDPLEGLDDLAEQIAATGIRTVDGHVLIDDRLWETFDGQEGPVPPIFINDNLLDITVTPAKPGQPATAAASPQTSAYQVESSVRTVSGSEASLTVTADPLEPRRLLLTGKIGVDAGPRLTVYRVPDAVAWARTLFVEALARAGIDVRPNGNPADLPARDSYRPAQPVASIQSPPLSAFGTMILQTSYNTGANALLCLLAVHEGSTDCIDGLTPMRRVIEKAGLISADVVLVDGQGADPASVTPAQMVNWLRWTQNQPWGALFKAGQPVLGESGSLAAYGAGSPAKGKIAAKTATSMQPDPATGRALFNVQGLAGFMTTDDGRELVFHLAMSGGTYPDVLTGLNQAGNDLAEVAAAFQQQLSR